MNTTRNEENKCVMARVMRQTIRYQENFTLKQYGTWDAAERAARNWVREMIRSLPPETPKKGRLTKSNKSGVVGVWLTPVRFKRKSGKEYEYWRWVANWPNCKLRGGVAWYVHQYGDDPAFVLAVLSRQSECVNRSEILALFDKIDGTKEFDAIIERRKLD
ncbi:MAG: hypothetical protein HYV96_03445 [Opitutae bacterium]|nr:hypothetical protein [Opitutae bacterium]